MTIMSLTLTNAIYLTLQSTRMMICTMLPVSKPLIKVVVAFQEIAYRGIKKDNTIVGRNIHTRVTPLTARKKYDR